MGSKPPLSNPSSSEERPEDDILVRHAPCADLGGRLLIKRIAQALQVPASTLYNPPNAISPSDARSDSNVIESECETLLQAYRGIRDPEMRRRLLALIQAAAERT
ncbi:hypothetical protein FV242_23310 [Methylobacterium sp. WL64]|nr:hypothetical protein FV242_23310 [Methylobacterium sp. WL64]